MTASLAPAARSIAAHVLTRVLSEDAFAAPVLDAALARFPDLDARERALATELTYGTLRTATFLEQKIVKFAPRGIAKLDAIVRAHLLLAAYQLLLLDRIPAFAAVSEAVGHIRMARGAKVAAFANAVLRRVAAQRQPCPEGQRVEGPAHSAAGIAAGLVSRVQSPGEVPPAPTTAGEAPAEPAQGTTLHAHSVFVPCGVSGRNFGHAALDQPSAHTTLWERAVAESTPAPLRQALSRSLGDAGATAFLAAGHPPLGLRVRLHADREKILAELVSAKSAHASFEKGRASPLAILVRGASDPRRLAPFERGDVIMQEEGAQVVALALGAMPGDTVLDACAGRGNKTSLLAERVGKTGTVDAADLHPSKLSRLRTELERLGLCVRATHAIDWSLGTGDITESYDRILVDAPCSGLGTLRRRPELGLRKQSADVAEIAALQKSIVKRAATCLRPGGTLVYAVCSVLKEEGEDVIESLLSEDQTLELSPFPCDFVDALAGHAPTLRIVPHVHGTDGYFMACVKKKA